MSIVRNIEKVLVRAIHIVVRRFFEMRFADRDRFLHKKKTRAISSVRLAFL